MADYIELSLDILRSEFPTAYYLLCGTLAGLEVHLQFGAESVSLSFFPHTIALLPQSQNPDVDLAATRETILRVMDAEQGLNEAILAHDIELRGSVEILSRFHDGLRIYIHGAVRCVSFLDLQTRFRASVISAQ